MDDRNNTGNDNWGSWNSGSWNSGNWNSGNRNSGYWNSGNENSGNENSGNRNSGSRNSGYWNSGSRNSGYWNSGSMNSGYGNSTDRSSGIFCNEEPQVISFNKPIDVDWSEIDHPHFDKFCLNKWILDTEMTDQEKKSHPDFPVTKGYWKSFEWEDAWANYWRDSDQEEKNRVLGLPNFDATVFKDITGIDVEEKTTGCDGQIIEIEGKKYKLCEV